ncbi:MAG: DNA polymerase III subunit delta [Bdellovibrionales bacterium]
MPAVEPQKFLSQLGKSPLPPAVLFYGEEEYLLREALDQVAEVALEGALRDFNLDIFYAQVDDTMKIRDAVETLPMMAAKRVVVVKEGQHLKAKDYELLLPLLESPVDSTVFIFVASHIDQRLKFFKKFSEVGTLCKFQKPFEDQIPLWIKKMATRYEKNLSGEAIEQVFQLVGSNLIDIDNELRKLSQYVGDRKDINVGDVKEVVSPLRTDTVFQLANAIGVNDRGHALTCLANLLEFGESPLGILALVSRHVRILTTIKDGFREGLTQAQLSSRVGVPPFFMKQYVEQSKSWSEPKIRQTYVALMHTDRALKSSPITPHIWLENFIIKTCN